MHTHELEPTWSGAGPGPVARERHLLDEAALRALPAARLTSLPPSAIVHLQRVVGNASVQAMLDEEQQSPVHEVVGSGGGSPLDSSTRSLMEQRLGHDFTDVRIHTGEKADESARSINARAYTVGTDVVFGSGHYAPDSATGQRVLAHELTHVVQQKAGPVAGTPAPGGIRLSDPSDPFEQAAESAAAQATSEPVSAAPTAPVEPAVQRQDDEEEEEETAQTLVAQRQEEEEEEEQQQA
jgi:Domain of unknown function (DUF4157)